MAQRLDTALPSATLKRKNHRKRQANFQEWKWHFGRPLSIRIGHRQRFCLPRFQNKVSVRVCESYFETLAARQNNPSEFISSVYKRHAIQIVVFNLINQTWKSRQEPEKLIRENLIPSLTRNKIVTTVDRIFVLQLVRNGGLNITLTEHNKNNLRWSKSLCLYNADPMTAEYSQHRIKRVMREKDIAEKKQSWNKAPRKINTTPCNWRRRKGHPVGSTPYPQKIRVLVNEDWVPRRSCISTWIGTKEYLSIMS